jgi:hypothetical protein
VYDDPFVADVMHTLPPPPPGEMKFGSPGTRKDLEGWLASLRAAAATPPAQRGHWQSFTAYDKAIMRHLARKLEGRTSLGDDAAVPAPVAPTDEDTRLSLCGTSTYGGLEILAVLVGVFVLGPKAYAFGKKAARG